MNKRLVVELVQFEYPLSEILGTKSSSDFVFFSDFGILTFMYLDILCI
jgi:hypothetical protein